MLKAIGMGLLFTLFVVAFVYVFVLVMRYVIDCMPDADDEED